jgi:hypothetical protein
MEKRSLEYEDSHGPGMQATGILWRISKSASCDLPDSVNVRSKCCDFLFLVSIDIGV